LSSARLKHNSHEARYGRDNMAVGANSRDYGWPTVTMGDIRLPWLRGREWVKRRIMYAHRKPIYSTTVARVVGILHT
jgi:hypothetical protein